MAKPVLSDPRFFSEESAFDYVEAQLWPEGPVCPHCGATSANKIGSLEASVPSRARRTPKASCRSGLRKCYACRGQPLRCARARFSRIATFRLRMWLQAIHLLCASKKGIITRQLQRMLGCGMKTAWHLGHRIREMMTPDKSGPIGGEGKTVEADDMEMGRSPKTRTPPEGRKSNVKVLSLVERGGPIRSMVIDHRGIGGLFYKHFDRKSRLVTDSAPVFKFTGAASHGAVDHSKFEWARGDVHTNTLEGFFRSSSAASIGVYQHIDAKHFDRYLAEFDFRMNTRAKLGIDDVQREAIAVKGAKGKRLTYQTTHTEA